MWSVVFMYITSCAAQITVRVYLTVVSNARNIICLVVALKLKSTWVAVNQLKYTKQPAWIIQIWTLTLSFDEFVYSGIPDMKNFRNFWSMTCISKAERVVGDRDGRFLCAKRDDLALHNIKQTEYKSQLRWEQMECEFLLRAHREREKWDNSPQLIHCALKTHYSLRRKRGKKNLLPKTERNTLLKVETLAQTACFSSCVKFLLCTVQRIWLVVFIDDELCTSLAEATHGSPGHPPTQTHAHTHTHTLLNTWWTHSCRTGCKQAAHSCRDQQP